MATNFIPLAKLEAGWNDRSDPKNSPGLTIMENATITDRGGVATRPGTELFGLADTTNGKVTSLHTAKTRGGTDIMIRASDTVLEYYNRLTKTWELLKSGFTTGLIFGFQDHNRGKVSGSIDNNKYTYYCNGIEPYSRWRNESWSQTTAELTGGETSIPIVSTLTNTVYYSGTASACTTTTIDITPSDWGTNIWAGFYVEIIDGAQAGKIALIASGTATQITFAAIAGLSGTPQFKIRESKFPATGTILIGATSVAYTAIPTSTTLTVASAPASDSGSAVTLSPQEFPTAPRGNILTSLFTQIFLAGSPRFPSTLFRAKIDDAADFTFSASRIPGEGDTIDIPKAVPAITDVNTFEDKLMIGSESYVEQIEFTQDGNDLPNRLPVAESTLIGPAGRSSKMKDDILFANKSNEITTLGRIATKDTRPLSKDIAWPIDHAIRNYDFNSSRQLTFKNHTLVACKENDNSTSNDIVLVYDNNRGVWVGKWNLPASCFSEYDAKAYMGSANSREVYKLFSNLYTSQEKNGAFIGYPVRCATGWNNYSKDGGHQQQFDTLMLEGYIKLNTKVEFSLYKDFELSPYKSFTWNPNKKSSCILGQSDEDVMGKTSLGDTPLGIELGTIDDDTGAQRFVAYFKVPPIVHQYLRVEWKSDTDNGYIEITNLAGNITEVLPLNENYIINSEESF
jgi:hypothetical protein